LVLFGLGLIVNQVSDNLLINLRKPEEIGYKIPQGFLFNYISCPNYLGEIVQWIGFALMAWNFPAFTFLIWTAANLLPRVSGHHQWYQDHFKDYPKNRKALIPRIW
jgi:3-oxo-5-alpha-steroid 4-dehydrogenase 1